MMNESLIKAALTKAGINTDILRVEVRRHGWVAMVFSPIRAEIIREEAKFRVRIYFKDAGGQPVPMGNAKARTLRSAYADALADARKRLSRSITEMEKAQ